MLRKFLNHFHVWLKDASINQSIIYFDMLRRGANKLVQNTNEISETVLMYD